ncbi:MAG: hypothetical protein OJF49_003314 [Ktedonobacterales bacterium]|nr:MAG: hypothetical protein OJF49_003314 [Ktedonobacterales bacterium]
MRGESGFIGTVERLEHHWTSDDELPDRMVVRSDDGRWRYSIPLMFINSVTQGAFHPLVQVQIRPDELTHYIVEAIPPKVARATTPPSSSPSAPVSAPRAEPVASDEQPVLRAPVAAEEMIVRKEPVRLGKVHVHKDVETRQERMSLPMYREQAVIEHIAADQYDGMPSPNPNEVLIPVIEERLVIRKEAVIVEYLRIRKDLVREQHEVVSDLRREVVTVTEERESESVPPPRVLHEPRATDAERHAHLEGSDSPGTAE